MSFATFDQIQEIFRESLGVHAIGLGIGDYFPQVGHLGDWKILLSFFETGYESIFNIERFTQIIEQQCDEYEINKRELRGKFGDIWYTLEHGKGKTGFRFVMHAEADADHSIRRVICTKPTIRIETTTGSERMSWGKSFDLNRFNIYLNVRVKIQNHFVTGPWQEFLVENNDGRILCVVPTNLDERPQNREEAIKFVSASRVYAFATQFRRV